VGKWKAGTLRKTEKKTKIEDRRSQEEKTLVNRMKGKVGSAWQEEE